MIRIWITIAALLLYVLAFNYYIYELFVDKECSPSEYKLIYNYLTLAMVIFVFCDIKAGFTSYMHEQFNNICILSVIINYILIILTHHTILQNPEPMFYAFNGSVFAVTIMIGSSIIRHGSIK